MSKAWERLQKNVCASQKVRTLNDKSYLFVDQPKLSWNRFFFCIFLAYGKSVWWVQWQNNFVINQKLLGWSDNLWKCPTEFNPSPIKWSYRIWKLSRLTWQLRAWWVPWGPQITASNLQKVLPGKFFMSSFSKYCVTGFLLVAQEIDEKFTL